MRGIEGLEVRVTGDDDDCTGLGGNATSELTLGEQMYQIKEWKGFGIEFTVEESLPEKF